MGGEVECRNSDSHLSAGTDRIKSQAWRGTARPISALSCVDGKEKQTGPTHEHRIRSLQRSYVSGWPRHNSQSIYYEYRTYETRVIDFLFMSLMDRHSPFSARSQVASSPGPSRLAPSPLLVCRFIGHVPCRYLLPTHSAQCSFIALRYTGTSHV